MSRGGEHQRRPVPEGESVSNLTARFAKVEQRVRVLVEENARLREQLRSLEKELEQSRKAAEELKRIQDTRTYVRKKLERVLSMLEALGRTEPASDLEKPSPPPGTEL